MTAREDCRWCGFAGHPTEQCPDRPAPEDITRPVRFGQIQCCDTWTDYPDLGRDTQCPVCQTTFHMDSPAEAEARAIALARTERAADEALIARLERITGNGS